MNNSTEPTTSPITGPFDQEAHSLVSQQVEPEGKLPPPNKFDLFAFKLPELRWGNDGDRQGALEVEQVFVTGYDAVTGFGDCSGNDIVII